MGLEYYTQIHHKNEKSNQLTKSKLRYKFSRSSSSSPTRKLPNWQWRDKQPVSTTFFRVKGEPNIFIPPSIHPHQAN